MERSDSGSERASVLPCRWTVKCGAGILPAAGVWTSYRDEWSTCGLWPSLCRSVFRIPRPCRWSCVSFPCQQLPLSRPGAPSPHRSDKPAVFRERTFNSNSISSDKVSDKVPRKRRLKRDFSGFKMSNLQGQASCLPWSRASSPAKSRSGSAEIQCMRAWPSFSGRPRRTGVPRSCVPKVLPASRWQFRVLCRQDAGSTLMFVTRRLPS